LTRAFVLGVPVARAALDRALPTLGVAGAARLGLVSAAGTSPDDEVHALVDLRPYTALDAIDRPAISPRHDDRAQERRDRTVGRHDHRPDARSGVGGQAREVDWWVASDLGELATGRALRTDHVLGVGGASTTLAQVTVRRPVSRVLDLGTGCGIQSLHALLHADRVTATDISHRALAFARFNAALAGVRADGPAGPDAHSAAGPAAGPAAGREAGPARLDLRLGSMLEPVADDRFDLVVSNPPFVITPRDPDVPTYEYRDAGRTGDAIVRELVTGVRTVLAPGGVAQLLGNWEVRRGERWDERVGAWLAESGLSGWVVQRELQDPAQYAETWIRDGGTTPDRDREAWRTSYGAWLDDFASRDVEAIGFGIVTLVDDGLDWRRLEEVTGTVRQPLGPAIDASLRARAALAGRDVADLRLVVAPDVTEERYLTPGEADPQVILLRQGGGFGRTVQAGTALAALVGACDGDLSVGQIVAALGALLERPADEVAAEVLPAVEGLLLDGLLTA
jgi:methylase of polypeptide subunit release factors